MILKARINLSLKQLFKVNKLSSGFWNINDILCFIIKICFLLLLGNLILFLNETRASVVLDSGYRNSHTHMDSQYFDEDLIGGEARDECSPMAVPSLALVHEVDNTSVTYTYQQGILLSQCHSFSESTHIDWYEFIWLPGCRHCGTDSNYEYSNCSSPGGSAYILNCGSVTYNYVVEAPDWAVEGYEWCDLELPSLWYHRLQEAESSYTFQLICQGDHSEWMLHISAEVTINSEAQPSGREFLINGLAPRTVNQRYVSYDSYSGVWYWGGSLQWDIPITATCGGSLTLTPSMTSGLGFAGNISITEEPVFIYECEPSLSVSPSEVRPDKTGGNTEAVVNVTLPEPAPPEGCQVNLIVEPVAYSGGHQHHDSGRPKGTITPSYISFSEGQTVLSATYKSSEVAGVEKIKAEIDGEIKDEGTIEVMVPGFCELVAGDGYVLIGWRAVHPQNHFGTENTLFSLLDLADSFYQKRNNRLMINDISLPWGGLFDEDNVPPPWIPWKPPHKSHRAGKNVDVDDVTVEGGIVSKSLLKKIIEKLALDVLILDHGNHFHLTFP